MMQFFTEVSPPPTFLLAEIVEWLAFSSIPDFWPDDEGNDCRSISSEIVAGNVIARGREFISILQIQTLLPEVDAEKYSNADIELGGQGVAEIKGHFETMKTLIANIRGGEGMTQLVEEYERDIKLATWMDAASEPLTQLFDIAVCEVFRALTSGRLKTVGLRNPEGNVDDYDVDWEALRNIALEPIEKCDWLMATSDFHLSELVVGSCKYMAVQATTEDVFQIFGEPNINPTPIQGRQFGSIIISDTDNGNTSRNLPAPPRPKGRPLGGNGIVRLAIINEFTRRSGAGELHEKRESIVQDAIDWAKAILGQTVSRSTMQRYLKPIFDAMPKINAHK